MDYKKINLYLGWLVFLIATVVFFITIEDTVSLWDCGEYITAAYKLEVGHPPGAPLFMVLGRLFSFFADPENVAVWINRLSALSSSLTVLFMFWSITLLVKKIAMRTKNRITDLSLGDMVAILGSGLIGSLAYCFSESFWFSAVEGEVYAMASLFTAVIFWAILRWDEEMMGIQRGVIPQGYSPDRWLILIMFLLGLAIGVHLLGILVVPAITYIIYFRYKEKVSYLGFFGVGILSIVILGFIQKGVISETISLASSFEVGFVKSLGLPFYSGTIFFFLLLTAIFVFTIRYARKKGLKILYSAAMGLVVLLIGYGSFAVIVIRSNANTPLDENDPENLVTLVSYLNREQYGSAPILYGPNWNSTENPRELWNDQSPIELRRFVVSRNENVLKAFKDEDRANEYAKTVKGATVKETYFETNAGARQNMLPTYAQNTLFPRMYWNQDEQRINGYKYWSGYDATDGSGVEMGKDGKRLPNMGENLTFFGKYQVGWMYWRYFMWNFSGRQNDIQGHGDAIRGNWLSGYSMVDNARLGNQDEFAPYYSAQNASNNRFFYLPLILGFIGLLFHFYRAPKDAFVVLLAFLFTGLAIIVYLNPRPYEPRERDYAYAGSFFFFAMWIGIGVYALYESFKSFGRKEYIKIGTVLGAGLFGALIFDIGSEVSMPTTVSWLIMSAIGGGAMYLMSGLGRVLKKDMHGAFVAVALCLSVPIIMGVQGWDDHDRSLKTSAHDLAYNYLNSCEKNGILFTNGDNDTFPLWYMQEVEGVRVDVRVCNLSLMQTDWYTDQMKLKAYDSEPLPIKFTEDQILMHAGNTDQVLFTDLFELFYLRAKPEIIKNVLALRAASAQNELKQAVAGFSAQGIAILNGASATDPRARARLTKIKEIVAEALSDENLSEGVYNKYQASMEVFSAAQGGLITMSETALQQFQTLLMDFEKSWNYADLADAMAFVRNDDNLVNFQGRSVRVFPSKGFILPVNVKNAISSGVISQEQKDKCLDEIKFSFDSRGLTREQVMMLDILGNNDWKRSIGFSSPGGSEVSIALYRNGYIKQNGMAFELSPLNASESRFNTDKMYKNLMENYAYGEMSNPDVLTDYYTRRHTTQYRLHFLSLAEEYISRAIRAEQSNQQAEMMVSAGITDDRVPELIKEEEIAELKTKAKTLIHRSLELMPAAIVIDYGEPTAARENYTLNGATLEGYSDGILHEYVGVLFMSGDKKGAEELGDIVATQLESIFSFYEHSDVAISGSVRNSRDLFAALASYFELSVAANDSDFGDPTGKLAMRTAKKIEDIYKTMFPSMEDKLKERANDNGESVRRGSNAGRYGNMLFHLQDYAQAMAVHYGWMEDAQPEPAPGAQDIDLDQLMRMQSAGDTVGK